MFTTMLSLPNVEAVKKFVSIANSFDFRIHLLSDKYKIDAKSIIGIFSLDLSKPIELQAETEYNKNFLTAIEPFLSEK